MNGEPDFIIAGGHKCGTTSLMRTLEQHSGIVRPSVDEPHTLISETYSKFAGWNNSAPLVQRGAAYAAIHSEERLTCDGSVLYLSHAEEFLSSYRAMAGEPPVIVVLRDPVRRAWSAYNYARLLNPLEDQETFANAIALDAQRLADTATPTVLSYLSMSNYAEGLARLSGALHDRLLVVIFEELTSSNSATELRRIQDHIGVPYENIELGHSNPGGQWKHGWMRTVANSGIARRLVRRGRSVMPSIAGITEKIQSAGTEKVALDSDVEAELATYFREQVREIETLIGRSLDSWHR